MSDRTEEAVTLKVECYAVPQVIAPQGRWRFELVGRGFELIQTRLPFYSINAAERAGRRMCKRFGWKVRNVKVEKLT